MPEVDGSFTAFVMTGDWKWILWSRDAVLELIECQVACIVQPSTAASLQ